MEYFSHSQPNGILRKCWYIRNSSNSWPNVFNQHWNFKPISINGNLWKIRKKHSLYVWLFPFTEVNEYRRKIKNNRRFQFLKSYFVKHGILLYCSISIEIYFHFWFWKKIKLHYKYLLETPPVHCNLSLDGYHPN